MRLDELIRGPSRPTRAQTLHRRRRVAALLAVAALALVLGALAGADGDGSGTSVRGHGPRLGWYGQLRVLAGAGPHSLGFEERARESTAIDRALARTPFVRLAGAQHRLIALTFDDGPGPDTGRLIDALRRLRVPGTFFVVGYQLPEFAATLRREIDLGLPIGDHTLDHANLRQLRATGQRREIAGMAQTLSGYGTPTPRLFRPPYGAYDRTTFKLLQRRRMLAVLWSIDSEDYTKPGRAAIVRNVVGNAQPGAIVLMHDGGGDRSETIAALGPIVRALRARGYRFVTVPRLLLENPPPAQQELPAGFNSNGAG
ncbi:MAG TPA: polysaccharide deacetylase family protein [Conexibacter sp.]|nr:polysaccharide deacetylase family protein [Conexibacter sp.]